MYSSEHNIPEIKPTIYFSELNFAYLRPVSTDHGKKFAVCNAEGAQLALFDNIETAFFAAKQHDLDLALLH